MNQYEPLRETEVPAQKASTLWTVSLVLNAVVVPVAIYAFVVIVPKFRGLFIQLGGKLPGITNSVIAISEWIHFYWVWFLPLYLIGLYVAFKHSRRERVWLQIGTLINGVLLVGLVMITPLALFYPLLEMQKQLN